MARVDREFLFECSTRYLTGELMKTRSEINKLPEARENAIDQDAIVFRYAFDWSREWPITEQS